MNGFDIVILGGGASGLAAAVCAQKRGARVLVLEKMDKPLKKLLATGNGRCNLANTGAPVFFHGADFARAAFDALPARELLAILEQNGLRLTVQDTRVYPSCLQASAVAGWLLALAGQAGVSILCGQSVKGLARENGAFVVRTETDAFAAPVVIGAGGGMAQPKLGSDGSLYALFERMGHRVIPPRPALSPLVTQKNALRGLEGMRAPAIVTLYVNEKPAARTQGEALFGQDTLSGVCAMQLAGDAGDALAQGKAVRAGVDFSPMLGLTAQQNARLDAAEQSNHPALARALFAQKARLLPGAHPLLGLAPAPLLKKLEHTTDPDALSKLLYDFPVPVVGVRGFEQAQVTRGGLDTRDFDPATMRSRLAPGLYACGELLDADGDCGGFNLSFAFISGMLAGRDAAGRIH